MILEIIIISILGTLFHFTYDFSKHNKIVALFSAVNESTWEHIKISLSAVFICSIVDGFIYGSNPNYFIAKFISLLIVIVLMPLIFYTYTNITKKPVLFVDITSFYIVIVCSQLMFNYILNLNSLSYLYSYIGTIGVFIIFGFYMVLTLFPIKNYLFKDPITNKYGIKGHSETFKKD